MLKSILKLEGAQKLTKTEQKNISGGIHICAIDGCQNPEYYCTIVGCKPQPLYV
jgi:hypothetical protein